MSITKPTTSPAKSAHVPSMETALRELFALHDNAVFICGEDDQTEVDAKLQNAANALEIRASELACAQAHFKLAHEELTKLRKVNAELVRALGKASIVTSYNVARTESNYLRSEGKPFEATAKIQFDEATALNNEVEAALDKALAPT